MFGVFSTPLTKLIIFQLPLNKLFIFPSPVIYSLTAIAFQLY